MAARASFVAVDLGASSGRVMECRWDGARFALDERHRFPNAGVRLGGDLHWNALGIWAEIQNGLRRLSRPAAGIGVCAWGVDYCLLDERGRLIGNPYHYRDSRTSGLPGELESTMGARELFAATGVQTMEINTAFQLAAMVRDRDPQLDAAHTLLMIPDFFQYMLSGERTVEYTEATTTELYDLRVRAWSAEVIAKLGLPRRIFPRVVMPGTVLGPLRASLQAELGIAAFPAIAVASHDTASAVAAIPGLDDQSAFLSSGTWSLMGVAVAEPCLSDAAFHGGFTNEGAAGGGALLMKNLTGLWLLQECVRAWAAAGRHYEWAELEAAAAAAEPFVSFIDPQAPGLQAPADMPAALRRYCLEHGQPAPDSPGQTARCVFQSLCLAYRDVADALERITGRTVTTIRVVGGGCLNRFLCQMTADATGRRVVAGPVEAAALGNALIQALATGHVGTIAEGQTALQQSIECQEYLPGSDRGWDEAFARYKAVTAVS